MELYNGDSLHNALQAGHEHLRHDFYRAFRIERTGNLYTVTADTPDQDSDNVSWTYEHGLEVSAEWDDYSRLLESYEYLNTPNHYRYHLPYLGELESGEAYIVFPYIAFDVSLERDEDGNTLDEYGELTDDLVGHGIAAILDNSNAS